MKYLILITRIDLNDFNFKIFLIFIYINQAQQRIIIEMNNITTSMKNLLIYKFINFQFNFNQILNFLNQIMFLSI